MQMLFAVTKKASQLRTTMASPSPASTMAYSRPKARGRGRDKTCELPFLVLVLLLIRVCVLLVASTSLVEWLLRFLAHHSLKLKLNEIWAI